jgi:uncharacterized protein
MQLPELEAMCEQFVLSGAPADAAHDIAHVRRVVENTRRITAMENADPQITIPAAWLHDCVAVAKDDPRRKLASGLAADAAVKFLADTPYPADLLEAVHHAIEAHSFSAEIPARTLEARVVQDADRLDSLGAVGVARCLLVGGRLDRPLMDPDDPFCERREPDDSRYTIDHFYAKLFRLPDTMQTESGREVARERAQVMRDYLETLGKEIGL